MKLNRERPPGIRENASHRGISILTPPPKSSGYCPIVNEEAIGRFHFFQAAERFSWKIVRYKDLERFGYKVAKDIVS